MDEQFIRENFPQRLKHYMLLHEKKRNDLVRDLGFKYSTIRDWEKGITIPRMDKAEALARYFNITTTDLIGEQKEPALLSPTQIGDIIRARREGMGLTHEQLAEQTGITALIIKKWEKGKIAEPRIDMASKLAKALDLPTSVILGVQEDETSIRRQRFRTMLYEELPDLCLTDDEIRQVINYIKFVISQRK